MPTRIHITTHFARLAWKESVTIHWYVLNAFPMDTKPIYSETVINFNRVPLWFTFKRLYDAAHSAASRCVFVLIHGERVFFSAAKNNNSNDKKTFTTRAHVWQEMNEWMDKMYNIMKSASDGCRNCNFIVQSINFWFFSWMYPTLVHCVLQCKIELLHFCGEFFQKMNDCAWIKKN